MEPNEVTWMAFKFDIHFPDHKSYKFVIGYAYHQVVSYELNFSSVVIQMGLSSFRMYASRQDD